MDPLYKRCNWDFFDIPAGDDIEYYREDWLRDRPNALVALRDLIFNKTTRIWEG